MTETRAPNPWVRLDKHDVIGALNAVGSRDPDILHARKATLLAPFRIPRFVGVCLLVAGGIATITHLSIIMGVPAILAGGWILYLTSTNVAAVEAGYVEYLKSFPC